MKDLPDYGGRENGHAYAIYGALLIFALYPSLPDQPQVNELQPFVQSLFSGTCGNSDKCDYLVVGDRDPITELYTTETDENGFIVSKKTVE